MEKTKGQAIKNKKDISTKLGNEITIGLTPKQEQKKVQKVKQANKNKKETKQKKNEEKKNIKQKTNKNTSKPNIKEKEQKEKTKPKKTIKIIKFITVIIMLITAIILFLLSDLFNIKQIVVTNNKKISTEEIINLSTLAIGNNMFKTTRKTIRNGIKTNPYIEDVNIKRDLTGIITLEIEEREPTYMLKNENTYIYINNQGYILDILDVPIDVPTITGYQTSMETVATAGNRLDIEDLVKLQDVIKITELSKGTKLENKITEINIENSNNYKLIIANEGKTVKFGNNADIKIKILKIEAILEQTKDQKGEIYFQNSDRTIFKENV